MGFLKLQQRTLIRKIQAEAEIDDSPNNEGFLDRPFTAMGPSLQMLRVAQSSLRAVLPKVAAFTKPVIVIGTGRNMLASKHRFGNLAITSMKTKNK